MAIVTRRWGTYSAEHARTASRCTLLTALGAVALALFGYVLFACLRMEGISLHAPIQSIAEIFRHH